LPRTDYLDSYNLLGAALVEKGRIEEGILQFEKIFRIDPYNKNAQENMRLALKKKKIK
jgi:tetratricopeptide (TPR) repeat protein